jgi:hypothetical protein
MGGSSPSMTMTVFPSSSPMIFSYTKLEYVTTLDETQGNDSEFELEVVVAVKTS